VPRHAVGSAAGRKWHDQRDTLGGIRFRRRTRQGGSQEEDGDNTPRKIGPQADLSLYWLLGGIAFSDRPRHNGLDNGLARYRTHTYYL